MHQRDFDRWTVRPRMKFRVTRVKWGRDPGYDERGVYWGTGAPVYEVEDLATGEYGYLRARDYAAAKAKVAAKYPGATFGR